MSNPYWKRKIQLKEAHEIKKQSSLIEQGGQINRRIQDVLDAIEAAKAR